MRKKVIKLNKIINTVLIMFSLLVIFNRAYSQDLSNGSIDFIFKPENGWTQFAIWVEDGSGEYIATVYLTNFIGRRGGGNRIANPDIDLSNGNRLSALPIWAHKRNVIDRTYGIANFYPPAESQSSYPGDIDAISGATPSTSTQIKTWQLSNLPYGTYNCWIEANRSYDQNEDHDYSSYRGQPSVVWNVPINVTSNPDSGEVLDYTGYGSTDGSDGNIHTPDATITTAANLLNDIGGYRFKAVYSPGAVSVKSNTNNINPVHSFTLNQNYPNPFNPVTVISWQLAVSSHVELSIYNLLGKKIATLVSQTQSAGEHQVEWDATGLASGLYFYKIMAGKHTDVKHMLLIM